MPSLLAIVQVHDGYTPDDQTQSTTEFLDLEQYSPPVVYFSAMNWIHYISCGFKMTQSRAVSLCVHYALAAMFAVVTVGPVFAGMSSKITDMANMNMAQNVCESTVDMSCRLASHDMSDQDDCEQKCNCCQGLCSAYLPVAYSPVTFPPAQAALINKTYDTKVVAAGSLFRPPISP